MLPSASDRLPKDRSPVCGSGDTATSAMRPPIPLAWGVVVLTVLLSPRPSRIDIAVRGRRYLASSCTDAPGRGRPFIRFGPRARQRFESPLAPASPSPASDARHSARQWVAIADGRKVTSRLSRSPSRSRSRDQNSICVSDPEKRAIKPVVLLAPRVNRLRIDPPGALRAERRSSRRCSPRRVRRPGSAQRRPNKGT